MSTAAPLVPGIRLLRILWRMLPAIFVAANVVAWAWLFDAPEYIKEQAIFVAVAVLVFRLVGALISEVLSPHRPGMRMIPMSDVRAQRMAAVVRGLLYVLLGSEIAIVLVRTNGWNESIAALVSLIRSTGLVLFTGLAIARTGLLARIDVAVVNGYVDQLRRLFVRFVFPVGLFTLVFVTFVAALGYSAMAEWVWSSALGTMGVVVAVSLTSTFLKKRLHRAVSFMEASDDTVSQVVDEVPAEPAVDLESSNKSAEDEDENVDDEVEAVPEPEADPTWIGVERIAGGVISVASVAVTVLWTLSIWGMGLSQVESALAAHVIPGWTLTYGDLAAAAALVTGVLLVGRLVATLLIFIVFPRADVDGGARYAILAILRYVVYFVAGYLGFSAVGFDTSALTVFAGAFGVALAFGLQDIFGNFLSGLIMLIERPVRVGDTIEVGATSGRIEAIRLRGTTIRTFDNTTIIIPNSQMLGERLKNLSHDMEFARLQVSVGVSYDSDPRRVERVLLRTALRDRRVMRAPKKPFVRFKAFGDSSLDFQLTCFTSQTGDRWQIKSDLHRAVFEALSRERIEIPFPQRDLHIRSDVGSGRPAAGDVPSSS